MKNHRREPGREAKVPSDHNKQDGNVALDGKSCGPSVVCELETKNRGEGADCQYFSRDILLRNVEVPTDIFACKEDLEVWQRTPGVTTLVRPSLASSTVR